MATLRFVVEFKGPKGWEVSHEGNDRNAALRHFSLNEAESFSPSNVDARWPVRFTVEEDS